MAQLHLASNLVRLRKEKKVTQDTLAEFIGVSKASVSKWENGQSFPDIETLPKLASYFSRSIDELMGYEAQLDKTMIRKVYLQLAEGFANKPLQEAYEDTMKWMKEYYACYPFLHQIATLLINHVNLAKEEKSKQRMIQTIIMICERICENSDDVNLCKDTLVVEALAHMMDGRPEKVLELLGDRIRPYMGNDELIAQAYQMTGNSEKAVETIQTSMYQKLISILQMGMGYLTNVIPDPERTKEITKRMEAVIAAFDLQKLHPNCTIAFYYQAAVVFCHQQEYDLALQKLEQYVKSTKILAENMSLHGDAFFDKVDEWIDEVEIGGTPMREKSLVIASFLQMFTDAVFAPIKERKEYKLLLKEIEKL